MTSDYIPIVLGIVLRDGRVLVARRPAGVHLGGLWEFPGGRLEAGESPRQALARELQEEVGIVVEAASHWMRFRHRYPERAVELDVWRVERFGGEPGGGSSGELRWVLPGELAGLEIPEANLTIAEALAAGIDAAHTRG